MSMNRLRAALRTNDTQATSVCLFTVLNLLACAERGGNTPWWLWTGAGLLWPTIAFVYNLIDPIPAPKR